MSTHYFAKHLQELRPERRAEIVYELIQLGVKRAPAGADLKTCLRKLTFDELDSLCILTHTPVDVSSIRYQSIYPDDLPQRVTGFILANPLPPKDLAA